MNSTNSPATARVAGASACRCGVLSNSEGPTSTLQPIIPALALCLRAIPAFNFEFLRIIATRLRAHLRWQTAQAEQVRAIDDAMERTAPLLWECLQNDPPKKRRSIWAAWQQTHASTETRAAALRPTCPEHLLQE